MCDGLSQSKNNYIKIYLWLGLKGNVLYEITKFMDNILSLSEENYIW